MDLVRDVLDKRLADRNGLDLGRVDSIVLEVSDGRPRVIALESGPRVLARRVWRPLEKWAAGLEVALGIEQGRPVSITPADILDISKRIKVNTTFAESPGTTLERWMRCIIRRWPRA